MKRLLALLLSVALWIAPAAAANAESGLFGQIDAILADLGKITGLQPRKPVQRAVIPRSDLKRFLEDRIRQELKPAAIRAEEVTLKKLGFVPPDFDLKATTVDLLTEQAAAFYDYRKKRLYLLDSESSAVQEIALVHELAHALADQHFNLARYMGRESGSDDGAMARMAVMEGQATWLMSEYMAQRMGLSLKKTPAIAEVMSLQTAAATGQFPVFDNAPLYMRENMLFPYVKGMLFQQALIEKQDRDGFTTAFRRPPASTQQILHPEKYLSGERPTTPELPRLRHRGRYRELSGGSIGELDHWILLTQYAERKLADSLSPEWKGGVYRVLESRKSPDRFVLLCATDWSGEAAARQFFQAYRRVIDGKAGVLEVSAEQDDVFAGRAGDGYFEVRRKGALVTSIEGMEAATDAQAP